MKVTHLHDVKKAAVEMEGVRNVIKQIPVSAHDGSPAYSFRVFTIGPGGNTPYHTHPFEHINYIIAGAGVIVNESGQEQSVAAGDFALVLPGEKHQYKNTADTDPLIMICAVPKEYE